MGDGPQLCGGRHYVPPEHFPAHSLDCALRIMKIAVGRPAIINDGPARSRLSLPSPLCIDHVDVVRDHNVVRLVQQLRQQVGAVDAAGEGQKGNARVSQNGAMD